MKSRSASRNSPRIKRATTPSAPLFLWELPDDLLFHVVAFVAGQTNRASVLCGLSLLCRSAYHALMKHNERPLWDTLLKEDYGAAIINTSNSTRRACKRLRRSPVHRVRDSHLLIKANTEIAYVDLSEMTQGCGSHKLSKANLRRLLVEYGPVLRINSPVSSGGLFLVQVCRARNVKECIILKCIEELVDNHGAQVNGITNESQSSRETALCVASVRAMPTVVCYLLKHGASPWIRCSGRFRLFTCTRKTLTCRDVLPIEFCQAMIDAEREAGANETGLYALNQCKRLLQRFSTRPI